MCGYADEGMICGCVAKALSLGEGLGEVWIMFLTKRHRCADVRMRRDADVQMRKRFGYADGHRIF